MTNKPQTEEVMHECAHCGGEAILTLTVHECWVSCQSCKASSNMVSDAHKAIKAWNTRTEDPRLKHYDELVGLLREVASMNAKKVSEKHEYYLAKCYFLANETLKQIEGNNE